MSDSELTPAGWYIPPDQTFFDSIHATRDQARDGLANDVLSTPENVAQQIAATLPPDCRILQFGTAVMPGLQSGTFVDSGTAPGKKATSNFSITAKSRASSLLMIATLTVQITAASADDIIGAAVGMYYESGAGFLQNGETKSLAIGTVADPGLRLNTSATFACVFPAEQRRTDQSGAIWTFSPFIQSNSSGSWLLTQASYMYIEVEPAAVTEAAATVEDIIHMVSYGQSLGAGSLAVPAKTTSPVRVGRALMPTAGVRPLGAQSGADDQKLIQQNQVQTLVSLKEATVGNNGETPSSCAGYMLTGTNSFVSQVAVAVSNHSIGGLAISLLSAGTAPYSNILTTVARTRLLARRNGLNHVAGGLWFTQGESNRNDSESSYLAALVALQESLQIDIRKIDRGGDIFPFFIDQNHNWTSYNLTECAIPLAQFRAAMEYPNKFYLVGPKYMLQTVSDGVHLTPDSAAWLGAYQGEIARRVLVLGQDWRPTHIAKAVRTGVNVVLDYYVPDGSLVIDTTLVTDPGNKGFRFIQTGGNSVTVTGVTQTGAKQITLTLSDVPNGASQTVGYADIGVSGAAGGPLTGPRGNVRDQATAVGLYGEPLYNWAVVQRKAVSN